ncbi:MAG: glutathione S-transferase family protein [Xanthobacteraceae bacterium]|nr:MAG: glutathione S-transferase family protein [Xanthobacteraceae bacterium]
MYTLYSMHRGGNSYKARLALAMLDIPYHLVNIDILRGESRTPTFLALNPSGQVPLLEVGPQHYIAESNAILWFLADGGPLVPTDPVSRAQTLQWMFFEQHSLEPNIGSAYFWMVLVKGGRELHAYSLEDWTEKGYRALQVMDNHLKHHAYFGIDCFNIADIALYATAHLAGECEFDLSPFTNVRAWLKRVERQPGFVTVDWRPEQPVPQHDATVRA